MAQLWELDPAAMVVGASGTVENIVTAGPTFDKSTWTGLGPSLVSVSGFPVLRLNGVGIPALSAAGVSLPTSGAFVALLRIPPSVAADQYGSMDLLSWQMADYTAMFSFGVNYPPSPSGFRARVRSVSGTFSQVVAPFPTDDAWHVWAFVWSPTAVHAYLDGALVGTVSGPAPGDLTGKVGDIFLSTQTYPESPAGDMVYAAMHTGVVDVAALTTQLLDTYTAAPPLIAAGSLTWTTAATLSPTPVVPPAPVATPGGSVTPPPAPEPQLPSPGVPDPVVRRVSELMPAPVLDARGFPIGWTPTSVVDVDYARFQVVVEGVDITYWDGAPLPVPSWSRTEPFGSAEATITVPQITPFHILPAWCVPGANVDIRLVKMNGSVVSRFAGVLDTFGHRADAGEFTLECGGVVFVDDLQLRQPAFLTQPRDIGEVVADVLTSAVSRRHTAVAPVTTGCLTSVLGGWEPRVTGYVQQLLATAVTGGRQWTVRCDERTPVLVQKNTTTIAWTVSNGARGMTVDLVQDWSQAPNVVYAEGIGSDGGRWRNAMYPNWRPDSTPAYPFVDPSKTMNVGSTDANTNTGAGVSDWQRRVGLPATGRFTQVDRARAIAVQTAAGIQRDGSVGPQTWAASFGTGSNVGTLDCFYLPVAYSPQVMPRLYGPDGADLGANPTYDANVLRVEDKIDFGQGVDKIEGTRASGEILAREIHPGWTGTITMELDPEESSKYEVQEGSNGRIRHFRGADLIVHTAQVSYGESTVTATVDTNARDYPTLIAIRDRERNATDPAKARVRRLNVGSFTEARATFDAESPAGHIPRHALFSNLWTVLRIPAGSYGSIVRTELTTAGSARPFSAAVFDRPITASALLGLVGNPLTADANPWSDNADALAAAGLLMSWGWAKQPAGYYPGEYSTPDTATAASPVTGRLVDDASWDYSSTTAPWLWVAEIASGSCYIEGRFWPGVE